jgi:hypothetical protein
MKPPIGTRPAGLGLALLLASGIAPGCGDSLSSLEVVNRKVYAMTLQPDYWCKGSETDIEAILDPVMAKELSSEESYPTEMSFGDDTFFQSFSSNKPGTYQLKVSISPTAREGDRHPTLLFVDEDRSYEALGTFKVLAAGVCP